MTTRRKLGSAAAMLFVATALQMLSVSAAQAAMTVIGGGDAHACFVAAEQDRSLRASLMACDAALSNEALSTAERAATFVNRGIINMHAQNLTTAIADYDQALKLAPGLAEAYVNKGIALINLGGRDEDAVAVLTQGLALGPSRPEIAYYTRGVAHELIGAKTEAYEDFKTAVELKPDWAEAAAQLARFSVVHRPTAAS